MENTRQTKALLPTWYIWVLTCNMAHFSFCKIYRQWTNLVWLRLQHLELFGILGDIIGNVPIRNSLQARTLDGVHHIQSILGSNVSSDATILRSLVHCSRLYWTNLVLL